MRIAVYGGSFNPPHVAHGMVASWLLWTGLADEVWLVPVYKHAFEGWHNKALAPFDRRISWCKALAADVDPRVRVCEIERHLDTPSYTIETLRALAAQHPDHRFRLVVGADALPTLPKWRAWPEIEEEFAPIVVGRAGYPDVPDAISFPALSSTEIRERLESGRPVNHLVTAGVARLLAQENR